MQYTYDGPRESVVVMRRFDAPLERVFDAWIDPATAEKWLFTTKTSTAVYELDVRAGGSYTITRRRGGKDYVGVGEYLQVDRPRRLVFTFAMPQFAADYDNIAVDIEPDEDGSLLTLTHSGLRPGYEKSTVKGWEKMFDALAKALA